VLAALATAVVFLSGLYLVALGLLSLLRPSQASGFLLGFATSARTHYLELVLRMLAGFAFVIEFSTQAFELPFHVFGWLLVGTTACLFLVPWQWHRRFAQWAVPQAIRYLGLVAFVSLALGATILAVVIIH
jgi:hypothetical protein